MDWCAAMRCTSSIAISRVHVGIIAAIRMRSMPPRRSSAQSL